MHGKTLDERFWSKVDRSGECWVWTSCLNKKGYGNFRVSGRTVLAHRMSYSLHHGIDIPPDMQIDHRTTCPKSCVNPDHLRVVTGKQNNENRAGAQANNISTGIRGVHFNKRLGKWTASAKSGGKTYHGGCFNSPGDAENAAIELRNRLFTHNDLDRR